MWDNVYLRAGYNPGATSLQPLCQYITLFGFSDKLGITQHQALDETSLERGHKGETFIKPGHSPGVCCVAQRTDPSSSQNLRQMTLAPTKQIVEARLQSRSILGTYSPVACIGLNI